MKTEWTHSHFEKWKPIPVPTDPKKHIMYLERAVYELIERLADELGHDNIHGVIDSLADQVVLTAYRAHERNER